MLKRILDSFHANEFPEIVKQFQAMRDVGSEFVSNESVSADKFHRQLSRKLVEHANTMVGGDRSAEAQEAVRKIQGIALDFKNSRQPSPGVVDDKTLSQNPFEPSHMATQPHGQLHAEELKDSNVSSMWSHSRSKQRMADDRRLQNQRVLNEYKLGEQAKAQDKAKNDLPKMSPQENVSKINQLIGKIHSQGDTSGANVSSLPVGAGRSNIPQKKPSGEGQVIDAASRFGMKKSCTYQDVLELVKVLQSSIDTQTLKKSVSMPPMPHTESIKEGQVLTYAQKELVLLEVLNAYSALS